MENREYQSIEEKKGLYLNIIIYLINKNGIYDYRANNANEKEKLNTFITENSFLVKANDKIKFYKQHKDIPQDEIILFYIRIRNNKFFLEKVFQNDLAVMSDVLKGNKKLDVNEKNISMLDECVWQVINKLNLDNPNDPNDYYLRENDILKFGYIKYFVKEIHIVNKEKKSKDKQEQTKDKQKQIFNLFNLIPECSDYKICKGQCKEHCNEEIYCLCQCKRYKHFNEIKGWLDDRVVKTENNKKTVNNYEFKIFHCKERIKKDPNCNGKECKYCTCKYCNTYYPLKIKLSNKEEIIDFYPYKKPEKSDYLILESFEYLSIDKGTTEKNIHIAELTGEDINIGRGNKNDIIIDDDYISREQATIKYNKEEGKLILKNRNKKSCTLILVKDNKIEVKEEKDEFLQIYNVFIEVKVMKEKDFLKIKNEESIYPFPYEKEKEK